MINKTIFAIAVLAGLVASFGFQDTLAVPEVDDEVMTAAEHGKAIPGWVDNNFKWYGEGKISQADLLNGIKHLMDHNLMHLSDKAAKEVNDLRKEVAELKQYKSQMLKSGSKGAEVKSLQQQLNKDSASISSVQIPNEAGELVDVLIVTGNADPNSLVQWAMRQSYSETNKDLQYHAEKVKHYNDMKDAMRDHADKMHKKQMTVTAMKSADMKTMNPDNFNPDIFNPDKVNLASHHLRELAHKGETSSKYWEDRYFDMTAHQTDSTVDDLNGIVVLCNVAMAQEVQHNESELDFLRELSDAAESESTDGTARLTTSAKPVPTVHDVILDRAEKLQQKIESMQVGNDVCEERLHSIEDKLQTTSDMTQMMQLELQDAMQKQNQAYQLLSSIMKSQHDTLKTIIQNMKA